jgi:hypothetical protein
MERATYRAVSGIASAALSVFLLLSTVDRASASQAPPVSQDEVMKLLDSKAIPPSRIKTIIDERGINFELTADFEQRARDAGADSGVIEALRQASQRYADSIRPSTGGLVIKTIPGEAEVYLNNVPKGSSSPEGELRLPDLQPGSYSLRVSLQGYQTYEKPTSVAAGRDQTVFVTLAQRTVARNDNPSPPSSFTALSIPGIKISPVQFFEGPHDTILPKSDRVYRHNFDHTTARSIYWELDIAFPAPGRRIDFDVDAIWYRQDGSELFRQTLSAHVDPTWKSSWHTIGYGWVDAGHWKIGSYRVELLFKGVRISTGVFEID